LIGITFSVTKIVANAVVSSKKINTCLVTVA
jgi:hypothetical protein